MEKKNILAQMGVGGQTDISAFTCEEDGEAYDVWKVTADNKSYVLKKAGEREISVYHTFLKSAEQGVPHFYKSYQGQDSAFFLMEYIEGGNLRKCDRESLTAVLDALIYLQEMYWERRELQTAGYGFETSLSDRQNRGRYLQDEELERAYETYLQLYTSIPRTLCHDDLLPFNVLIADGKAVLIDWEDAGILPYPTSLSRLIAHGEEDDTAFFYMKEEDKAYAVEYFYEHFIKGKGIAYHEYRRTLDYFLLYEYCEWIMVGNKYGDTESARYKRYLAKAREHTCIIRSWDL